MDAKTLCLGVLLRGEASGYEIKKAFEEGPFSQFLPPGRVGHLIDQRIAWYREALERMESCACTNTVPAGAAFVRGMGIAVYRAAADYLETHRAELIAEISESATLVAE